MLGESIKFTDWASLVNTPGVGAIIAAMVIEERNKVSMFTNIPGLIQQKVSLDQGLGDEMKFYKMTAARGVGLPGEYQADRQLSGNEAESSYNFAIDKVTVGIHRYAVAIRQFTDAHFTPKQMIDYIMNSISAWWVEQADNDTFTTLFRDYPTYYAERNSIVSDQAERLLSLFGRGARNDIGATVTVKMPNGKIDIEGDPSNGAMDDDDTLSDVFLRKLNSFCQNVIGMAPISMEDSLANYGLIVDQSDINFLRANSSSSLEDKIKTAFQGQGWNSPIFKNVIMDLEGIRLFKWDPIANNDSMNSLAAENSPYKGLNGTAIYPMGRVLAAAQGGEEVTGLKVWGAGDLAIDRGITKDTNEFFLLVSNGAKNFPYFEGGAVVGKDSINKAQVTSDIAAFDSCNLTAGEYVGRLQIGQGVSTYTRYKIYYTGPTYVGFLKVGAALSANNTYVEDVYKLKVHAIATWNNTTKQYNAPVDPADTVSSDLTFWDALKSFLAIDPATNVISRAPEYSNFTYLANQRIHMFDVVRSIAFGKNIMYEAVAGKEMNLATETRDYGAVIGNGLTAVNGKKVVTNAQGLVNSYVIVAFKRPQNLL